PRSSITIISTLAPPTWAPPTPDTIAATGSLAPAETTATSTTALGVGRTVAEEERSEERRQGTAMYCAFGAASDGEDEIDPEDLAEAIEQVNAACEEALRACGPLVTRPMGDGKLIYFGLPMASGDDAARAVAAGLRIIAAVRRLARGWV